MLLSGKDCPAKNTRKIKSEGAPKDNKMSDNSSRTSTPSAKNRTPRKAPGTSTPKNTPRGKTPKTPKTSRKRLGLDNVNVSDIKQFLLSPKTHLLRDHDKVLGNKSVNSSFDSTNSVGNTNSFLSTNSGTQETSDEEVLINNTFELEKTLNWSKEEDNTKDKHSCASAKSTTKEDMNATKESISIKQTLAKRLQEEARSDTGKDQSQLKAGEEDQCIKEGDNEVTLSVPDTLNNMNPVHIEKPKAMTIAEMFNQLMMKMDTVQLELSREIKQLKDEKESDAKKIQKLDKKVKGNTQAVGTVKVEVGNCNVA